MRYKEVTFERQRSFGGVGHATTVYADSETSIEKDGDTIILRKGTEVKHIPWSAVLDAVPIEESKKGKK